MPTMYCELILLAKRWKDAIPLLEGSTGNNNNNNNINNNNNNNHRNHYDYMDITRKVRILYYIGFMLNAPLLPSYPCLVQYTNLSLGVVNALLHTNLTLAWGMQAWSIYNICLVMKQDENRFYQETNRFFQDKKSP